MQRILLPTVALLALTGLATAQNGADDCASATPIAGLGQFAFDNNGATIDGPADCAGQPVRKDIWYVWTAPATDAYFLETCGLTALPTRIAVYDGFDCATYPLIDCSAALCGNQSRVTFLATGGQQYLMRIGSRQVGVAGSGQFNIGVDTCQSTPPDQFAPNHDCPTAAPVGDGSYPGLFVTKADPDYFEFVVAPGATLQLTWTFIHNNGDVDCFLYDACGGSEIATSTSGTDDEAMSWQNTDTCDRTVYCRTEIWTGSAIDCNSYDFTVSGTGGTGNPCTGGGVVIACDPANNHSGGTYAQIAGSGSLNSADAYPLHLEVTSGPAGEFGYFLASGTLVDPGISVSQGMLCLGSPQVRFSPTTASQNGNPDYNSIGQFDGAGVYQNLTGTSTVGSGFDVPNSLPTPIGVTIQPGETWIFQAWYRDGADSNFTTAAAVTFQ